MAGGGTGGKSLGVAGSGGGGGSSLGFTGSGGLAGASAALAGGLGLLSAGMTAFLVSSYSLDEPFLNRFYFFFDLGTSEPQEKRKEGD